MAEANFRLSNANPQSMAEVAVALQEIQRFLQELVVFSTAAPVSSSKGIFTIYYDGTTLRLYVQGKIGQGNVRRYRKVDNT